MTSSNVSSLRQMTQTPVINVFFTFLFSPREFSSLLYAAVAGLVGYVTLCSLLRYRRVRSVRSRYGYTDRASLSKMSNHDAFEISQSVIYYEFPLFYDFGTRLALFETYASDNVARLLVSSSDLYREEHVAKRYEDTEVIYSCFAMFPPTSALLHQAVARMNYLHAPYIRAGKILQEDLLYVLYASAAEPIRFINQYEWRQLKDMEIAALATLWKHIGDMMSIDYKALLKKETWTDGIDFLDDLCKWASDYEDEHMRPSAKTRELGQRLLKMKLESYPKLVRPLGYQALPVLFGNRLRRAFGKPEPPLSITVLVYSLLLARKLFIRFFCLPRYTPAYFITQPDENTGRIKHLHYMKEPWYVPGDFVRRWNWQSLVMWLSGCAIPGDGGAKLKPEGFLFEDLGPLRVVGEGKEEALELAESVRRRASGGCPFSAGTASL